MSTNEHERCEHDVVDLMSNFCTGLPLLMVLAGGYPVVVSREETLETFAAFEAAYEPLAAHSNGMLQTYVEHRPVPVLLTAETFERVKQLGTLLRLAPDSPEAQGAAAEIQALADACLRALAPDWATSSKPAA